MRKLSAALLFLLFSANLAHAQGSIIVKATDPSAHTTSDVGDATNTAIRVLLVGTPATSLNSLPLAIASTTSGSKGLLGLCAATTSAPTYTTSQNDPLSCTTAGSLRVDIMNGGGGGTSAADNATFTSATTVGTLHQAVAEVASPTTVTEGHLGAVAMTLNRGLKVVLYNTAGVATTLATDVIEDAAESSGVAGPAVLAVRRDTAASSSGTAGDYSTFNVDDLGRLWSRPQICESSAVTSVPISTSSSGNTQLVALQSSQVVYVCGYSAVVASAVSFSLVTGTGTACATGEANVVGPAAYAANGGISSPNGGAVIGKGATSSALCMKLSSGVQTGGILTYVQTAQANP